jgi:hypothetical protein
VTKKKAFLLPGSLLALLGSALVTSTPGIAQQQQRSQQPAQQAQAQQKPNILFIMADDIGMMQPGVYHRGWMVGETPNIDRIAKEGGLFMDYSAMQSCTSGRAAFVTGMYPLRVGLSVPMIPGMPAWLRKGTPTISKMMLSLGYTTGQFGKNHLGDTTESLPTAHGFQEFWGYLYHLDAMQGVSFPDINKTPTDQAVVPPCKNTPIKGLAPVPGAVDPKTTLCMTPPRPVLACKSSDGTVENQGNLRQGDRLPRPQRPEEDRQAVLRLLQPGADARHYNAIAEI